MATVEPIDILRQNLELAREQLKTVDDNIRRITGRDPSDDRFPRRINDTTFRRPGTKSATRLPALNPPRPELVKQKLPDDDLQVSLASSVICVNESRSRLEAAKNMRKSDKDRGRRMLGILQGTLNQFRAESAAATSLPQMTKRRQVDAKLEARAEEEREVLRRERAQLFRSRREQQMEINLLQQKVRAAKEFELWKSETEKMIGFCRTETVPHIFFRPKVHNDESNRRVEETAKAINNMINCRQRKLNLTIDESAAQRRRLFSLQSERGQLDVLRDNADNRTVDDWASTSPPRKSFTLTSLVHSVNTGDPSSMKSQKSSEPSGPGNLETGDLSDGSENLAMEGDDEPVLMEEEDHLQSTQSVISSVTVKPKDLDSSPLMKNDTRTVHMSACD